MAASEENTKKKYYEEGMLCKYVGYFT